MIQKVGGLILVGVALAAAFGCGAFFALTAVFASGQQFESHVTIAIGSPHPAEPTAVATPDPTLTTWAEATAAPPVDVETVEPTAVPEQWDIAGLPTLDPCYFNMYTEECRHYIEVPGYDWTAVTAPWDAPPVDLYGAEMTYCHDAGRVWTAEERETTRRGFVGWAETGISFREVPYSTAPTECLVLVTASDAPGMWEAGRGKMGVDYGLQGWIWSNTAVMPYNHYIVMHEVGHVLNLGHDPGPNLMNEYVQYVDRPTAENIAQARAYWFGLD